MKHALLLLPLAFTLAACTSSDGSKETPPLMSERMANRLTKPDLSRRSIYDKSMQASLGKTKGSASRFSQLKHDGKTYSGTKTFADTSAFKTTDYARRDDKSAMGRKGFAEAERSPAFADDSFATNESRMAGQTAREAGSTFKGSDRVFGTSDVRDAAASQRKNTQPSFIQLEDSGRTSAYTEDQVRKLLGRD
jgi:hypothetical protein